MAILVAIEKEKTSFMIPVVLREALSAVAAPYGEKRQWLVTSAAILAVLEMSPEVLRAYVKLVSDADFGDISAEELLKQAKAGDLREQIEYAASKPSGPHLSRAAKPRGGGK